mmetsp:Transcript_41289/g.113586  ORF Transcript_41289/g.113586 Transcript_41289/m.113586 type:complete len:199 (+) Transcript_41289:686-1282(+)
MSVHHRWSRTTSGCTIVSVLSALAACLAICCALLVPCSLLFVALLPACHGSRLFPLALASPELLPPAMPIFCLGVGAPFLYFILFVRLHLPRSFSISYLFVDLVYIGSITINSAGVGLISRPPLAISFSMRSRGSPRSSVLVSFASSMISSFTLESSCGLGGRPPTTLATCQKSWIERLKPSSLLRRNALASPSSLPQ